MVTHFDSPSHVGILTDLHWGYSTCGREIGVPRDVLDRAVRSGVLVDDGAVLDEEKVRFDSKTFTVVSLQ